MLKQIKEAAPYLFLLALITFIGLYSISRMLIDPLTNTQLMEIKTKITAYNLEFVSVESKQLIGCGSGHNYRVPVNVKNKDGSIFSVSYCSGGLFTPSQIKI